MSGRCIWRGRILLTFLSIGLGSGHGAFAEEVAPGRLSLGVQGMEHTLDAMRFGDLRPTLHSDFGGRLELTYGIYPKVEVSLAGYRGRSHFHYDTGFEKGEWRDSDWIIELGPNVWVGEAGPAGLLLGGSVLYGEARSRLTVRDPVASFQFDGPTTFMVGGMGRLTVLVPLLSRLEGTVQLGAGVMKARAKDSRSGNLFEWNGRMFSATVGLRAIIMRGKLTAAQ